MRSTYWLLAVLAVAACDAPDAAAPSVERQSLIQGTISASTQAIIGQAGHNIANTAAQIILSGESAGRSVDELIEVTNYFYYEGIDFTIAQAIAELTRMKTVLAGDNRNTACVVLTLTREIDYTISLLNRAAAGEELPGSVLVPYPQGPWPRGT